MAKEIRNPSWLTAEFPEVKENIPLAPLTYFKVGGPARYFYQAKNSVDFAKIVSRAVINGLNYVILGNGANVIVADSGFPGLVIKHYGQNCSVDNHIIKTDAGTPLSQLINYAAKAGLAGLEFLAGIPGSVGGAIYGNAGGVDLAIGDRVASVTIVGPDGKIRRLEKDACQFSYRMSRFKKTKEGIIECELALQPGPTDVIMREVLTRIQKKKRHQPLKHHSAGCVFKNPPGQSAGRLIDQAGLKGKKIGGAVVSEIHGNFIVNDGSATSEQIVMLISLIKQQIRDRFGIQLNEEIQYIGF